jgi:glycosyltransferase involved in cell wall biosynthesis
MSDSEAPSITVVVPVYNEAGCLTELHERINSTLGGYGAPYELLFVDDGSQDGSWELLRRFHEKDAGVRVVRFVRNFGQQMALSAGLSFARGNTIVLIDADLQTAPEDIPKLVDKLSEGYDIVYGVRRKRKDPWYRRAGSWVVSWALRRLTDIDIPDSATGFLALDRRLVDHTKLFCEKTKFHSGTFAYLSYGRWSSITVEHYKRSAGTSHYSFFKLVQGTLDFFCNYTQLPLRLPTYLGLAAGVGGAVFFVMGVSLWVGGRPESGEVMILGALGIVGGMVLFCMGMLGEYVGRIFTEVKERPPYVVSEVLERHQTDAETTG